jgi:hypothetical protein
MPVPGPSDSSADAGLPQADRPTNNETTTHEHDKHPVRFNRFTMFFSLFTRTI